MHLKNMPHITAYKNNLPEEKFVMSRHGNAGKPTAHEMVQIRRHSSESRMKFYLINQLQKYTKKEMIHRLLILVNV